MSATETVSTDDPKAMREMRVSELSPLSDTGLLLLMAYYSSTIDPPANATPPARATAGVETSHHDASAELGATAPRAPR
jgi:hypothetical protein